MINKTSFALLLVVGLPIIALIWMSWEISRNEQLVFRTRYQELVKRELNQNVLPIKRFLKQKANTLDSLLNSTDFAVESLRDILRTQPAARQFFLLNSKEDLIFPNRNAASQDELQFIERTKVLVKGHEFSGPPKSELTKKNQKFVFTQSLGKEKFSASSASNGSWHSYYWNNGLQLIYYVKHPNKTIGETIGGTIGVELKRAYLLSEIITLLPESNSSSRNGKKQSDGRIQLKDSQNRVLYEWGDLRNDIRWRETKSLPLPKPLSAWKLVWNTAADSPFALKGSSSMLSMLYGITALVLTICGLAYYLYRENSRTIREALMKTNFVNQVSHELKTPLTSIRMYAELLANNLEHDQPRQKKHATIILQESERLSRLITNVLNFRSSENGVLKLNRTSGLVSECLSTILEQYQPEFERAKIAIKLKFPHNEQVRIFDRDIISQIIGNLLSNALKYASQSEEIRIAVEFEGSLTTIRISDKGPGIPVRLWQKVFEPFFRISNTLTDGVNGAGIGLSISRQLAQMHSGDITLIECEQGACFEVSLETPIAKKDHK